MQWKKIHFKKIFDNTKVHFLELLWYAIQKGPLFNNVYTIKTFTFQISMLSDKKVRFRNRVKILVGARGANFYICLVVNPPS